MSDWLNGNDWVKKLEKQAEEIRTTEEVDKRLLSNVEYQSKIKDIDIQLGLIREKIEELNERKLDLRIEYGNKELENMGSKYRLSRKKMDSPFDIFG